MTPTLTSETLIEPFGLVLEISSLFLGDPCNPFCGKYPKKLLLLWGGNPFSSLWFHILPTVALFMIVVNDSICCFRSFKSFLSLPSMIFSIVIAFAFTFNTLLSVPHFQLHTLQPKILHNLHHLSCTKTS